MSFPLPDNILQLPDITAKQIMQRMVVLQNGDVAKAMKKAGYNYEINYGVSIPQLRNIASQFNPDRALAIQLRNYSNIREALILSSMLDEPNKISIDEALNICEFIDNIELIEQFSRNLFARLNNLVEFSKQLVHINDYYKTICFYSLGWSIKFKNEYSTEDIEWLIAQINIIDRIEDKKIAKSLLFLMQAIVSILPEFKEEINKMAENFSKSDNSAIANIGTEFLWLNAI